MNTETPTLRRFRQDTQRLRGERRLAALRRRETAEHVKQEHPPSFRHYIGIHSPTRDLIGITDV